MAILLAALQMSEVISMLFLRRLETRYQPILRDHAIQSRSAVPEKQPTCTNQRQNTAWIVSDVTVGYLSPAYSEGAQE